MIKVLHTADWHIGQTFYDYDRKKEHAVFFDWLRKQVREEAIDLLLIAGDVFDSPNPSAESQKTYYRFLHDITKENPDLQTIIIAGNHDSAARLEAPNPLLEEMRVTIRGVVKRNQEGEIDFDNLLIPVYKRKEIAAWVMAVPYLRQGDYPPSPSYGKGVAAMYDSLYTHLLQKRKPDQPILAMGHLQASGAELSTNDQSERIIIGGLESVSFDSFKHKEVAYTALGHLHRAQHIAGNETIRYAGSPLPMSFSEKNYKQGVNLIELDSTTTKISRILFEPPAKLISIPKNAALLNEVLNAIRLLPDGSITEHSPYLEVKVKVDQPQPSMRHKIEQALVGKAVRLAPITPFFERNNKQSDIKFSYEELQTINPTIIAEDYFIKQIGNDMPEDMRQLLLEAIQEVKQ